MLDVLIPALLSLTSEEESRKALLTNHGQSILVNYFCSNYKELFEGFMKLHKSNRSPNSGILGALLGVLLNILCLETSFQLDMELFLTVIPGLVYIQHSVNSSGVSNTENGIFILAHSILLGLNILKEFNEETASNQLGGKDQLEKFFLQTTSFFCQLAQKIPDTIEELYFLAISGRMIHIISSDSALAFSRCIVRWPSLQHLVDNNPIISLMLQKNAEHR